MDLPGSAYGVGTGLGKPDVAGLPLFHEPRHGAHRLLHRNRGIDAGHAVDVQAVDAQPLEAFLTGLDQVLGRAAAVEAGAGGGPRAAGLGVDHDLVAPPLDGLADELVVMAVAVAGRGVEEVDPQLEGPVQRGDGLVVVAGPVHAGHAQAAEPHGRHLAVGGAELVVFHSDSPGSGVSDSDSKAGEKKQEDDEQD